MAGKKKIWLKAIPLNTNFFRFGVSFGIVVREKKFNLSNPLYNTESLCPLRGGNYTQRRNVHGVLTQAFLPGQEYPASFIQLYDNGMIEAANGLTVNNIATKQIDIRRVEESLLKEIKDYLKFYQALDLSGKIFAYLTISDIKGYTLFSEKKSIHYLARITVLINIL